MLKILLLALPLAWSAPDTGKTSTQPAAKPATPPAAAPAAKPASSELKTDDQMALYALGAALGQRASDVIVKAPDLKYIKMGLEDSMLGKTLKVDQQVANPKLQAFIQKHSRAEGVKKNGKEYADKVAKEKGAQVFPSGLVMVPTKEGTGASPAATDKVKVHYEGKLTDGRVFDSSLQRGTPAEFPLNGVIPCWTEAVQKMKVGGEARIVCPSSIAYGDQGRPPLIPGGATLTFTVQLIDIVK